MKSIKTVLLRRFLLIFTVLALCILSGLTLGFRELSIKNAEDKALAIAYVIKAGLTAHMKSGIMEEKEYLDCENPDNPTPLDDALIICSALFAEFARIKLSTMLNVNSAPEDISDNEAKALQELRALSIEDQDKFINLIRATPLIK